MRIRKGIIHDIAELKRLWLGFFSEDTGKISETYLKERAENGELLVAEDDGKIAGFLAFKKNFFFQSDYNEALIVEERYRLMGTATALLNAFEKQAEKRRCRRIFSSAEPGNTPAVRMHEKGGFERCGHMDHIWREGVRDEFFTKKLRRPTR